MASAHRRLEVLHWHLDPRICNPEDHCSTGASIELQPCRAAAPAAVTAAGPPVLVGGMVMDLQAYPSGPEDVQRGGSVPGRVTQSAGGVARNVGEALALLLKSAGRPQAQLPLLVSAVGDDLAGRALLQHWQSLGLSTACISQLQGGATPTVSVVFDLAGEVAACVADVALLERQLGPPLLRTPHIASALAAAPVVMLDGNLGEPALREACQLAAAAGVPVWFEPVSVPKATRAAGLLSMLTYISPNEKELGVMAAAARQQEQQQQQEARPCQCACTGSGGWCACALCGSSSSSGRNGCCGGRGGDGGQPACRSTCCCSEPAAAAAASASRHAVAAGTGGSVEGPRAAVLGMLPDIATLLLAGVRHIVLTLGADGAALCQLTSGRRSVSVCHMPALPATVVNCSGAGDCLVAGCLFGLAQGLPAEAALAYGNAAATAAVESLTNVPAGLAADIVRQGAETVAAGQQVWQLELQSR